MMIHHALTQAHQHLTVSTVTTATNASTHDNQPPRHSVAITTGARNHQLPPSGGGARNKPMRSTTFHTSRTASMDVIELKKKKKPPERGASFVDKKEDPSQDKAVSVSGKRSRERKEKRKDKRAVNVFKRKREREK